VSEAARQLGNPRQHAPRAALAVAAGLLLILGCGRGERTDSTDKAPSARPWILLVTLDTTRADAIGPEAQGVETPAFNALAARGLRFRQAYATTPETLPSHSSMLTGLYPGGHGVHENGRQLSGVFPVAAEQLRQHGYRTAAFVSSYVLARRFGLARGFEVYDDELPEGRAERTAQQTTDRAIASLQAAPAQPLFVWVHYFDPHYPYEPPEPFRTKYPQNPYLGEVAAMDEQMGRLVEAFDQRARAHGADAAVILAADHGEGLGDHGESQHGNLLYQATMLVPLAIAGPGVAASVSDTPVSIRRIYDTILDWAGLDGVHSLKTGANGIVMGEAMKPFLSYGWQPQIMAVEGRQKVIFAGRNEVYDVVADPGETRDLSREARLSADLRAALDDYPVPSIEAAALPQNLDEESRRKLASLGYVSAGATPAVRKDAPRPVDMAHLFDAIDRASGLFVREEYAAVIPLLQKILAADPHNLDAALRLATAHSSLGQSGQALAAFQKASAIAPRSPDVRVYLALHYTRGKEWREAVPMLERLFVELPERLPVVEGLAIVRERQGRIREAIDLHRKIHALRPPTARDLVQLGELAMHVEDTPLAIESFERARALQGPAFRHDLELGVLYFAAGRYAEARDALDRVAASHPEFPMALFTRAQVSVLLNEPDRAERIARARRHADASTRELIAREQLFR
jgi:choline-sulfatase